MDNLKEKVFDASCWRLLESFGVQAVNFVIQIILARLLLPEEFGMIAMIWVFVVVTETFIRSGYGKALVQKQNATHVDECSIFYFNIFVSFLGCCILCLIAPWIAAFYEQPNLAFLVRVLSLKLIIGAFGHVHFTLLAKRINFKARCLIDIVAVLISGIVGVIMAINGFGVWSLVAQQICRDSVKVILLWIYSSWRPAWMFSFASLRSMFTFGSKLLCANLMETIFRNIYYVIIGKLFPASELGFYSRGHRLQELPAQNITSVVTGVTFPVFSQLQDDKVRLRKGVRASLRVLALGTFPVMIGLAIVAGPFVTVLLTDKWIPCVPYLQIFCIVGMLYPFYILHGKVLLAVGRSDLFFYIDLFKNIIITVSIVVTYRWGIIGLLYGQTVSYMVSTLLVGYFAGRLLDYSLLFQLVDLLPYLLLSMITGICVYAVRFLEFENDGFLLVGQIFSGMIVYTVLCYLFRLPAFTFMYDLIKKRSNLFIERSI